MNKTVLAGTVVDEPKFSHETYKEKFYRFLLSVNRESGTSDILSCVVSEILVGGIDNGNQIKIEGDIRTRNVCDETVKHLDVFVFVNKISAYEEDENLVDLQGYICKKPTYRATPLGRQITDLLVASNRAYGKSAYIPTIAWGRNAIRTSEFNVGTRVKVLGRLQSREYNKRFEDGTEEVRTTYELSASMIDVVEESEGEE